MKNKLKSNSKKAISFILAMISILGISIIPVGAVGLVKDIQLTAGAVDLAGGIQKIVDRLLPQLKKTAVPIFIALTAICLIITIFFGIKAFISFRKNEDINFKPVVCAGIATIISGMFTSVSVFNWFGV